MGHLSSGAGTAVLLVSHGSRDPRAEAVVGELVVALRARLGLPVREAHLDFTDPTPVEALRSLAADGYGDLPLVPLLFTPGYHVTQDIPAAVTEAGVAGVRVAPALVADAGPARDLLLRALGERLADPGVATGPHDGLVLASAGSSSSEARRVTADLARDLGALHGVPCVAAYASAGSTSAALAALREAGVLRPAVASLFVAPGRLPDAVARECDGVPVAPPLGATPAFVELLAERVVRAQVSRAPQEVVTD